MRKMTALIDGLIIVLSNIQAFAASSENLAFNAFVDVSVWDKNGETLMPNVFSAKNLVNGNEYSVFQTPIGTERAELIMDLYSVPFYNRIYIKEAYSAIQGYDIATSNDKKNWMTVYQGLIVGPYGKTINFRQTNDRYIRLQVTKTNNKFSDAVITISQWQVFADYTKSIEDLENSIYLSKIKQQLLTSELVAKKI